MNAQGSILGNRQPPFVKPPATVKRLQVSAETARRVRYGQICNSSAAETVERARRRARRGDRLLRGIIVGGLGLVACGFAAAIGAAAVLCAGMVP